MSKTYMRKEKGDNTIVCVSLVDWAKYRNDGFVFVEPDKDGNTPKQQFLNQKNAAAPAEDTEEKAPAKKKASKKTK